MAENSPYQTPSVRVEDEAPVEGSPWIAVIVGAAIDIGGTIAVSFVLGAIYATTLIADGLPVDELQEALTSIPPESWISIIGMGLGFALSLVAGFVCAAIAKRSQYKYALIVAIISTVFGVALGAEYYGSAVSLLLAGATFATVMLGAWLNVTLVSRR